METPTSLPPTTKKTSGLGKLLMKYLFLDKQADLLDTQWMGIRSAFSNRAVELLKMATRCEKQAKKLDLSNSYEAGVYAGKAEAYREWSKWMARTAKVLK
jgi:hypothetical protein